jgi:phospholipid/cholesterol/gamma-HCH transport system substrate-binding protein
MTRNLLETAMGAIVLLVAGGFLMFVFEKSAVKTVDGYEISARFSDVSGIGTGSEIRIGGLKVGAVGELTLDPETYQATLIMQIKDSIKLPKDSSAAVVSSGLIGDKFIKIEPGGSDTMLENDGEIRFTQSSVSFEELIGKFVFSGGGVDNAPSAPAAPAGGDAEPEKDNPFSLGL